MWEKFGEKRGKKMEKVEPVVWDNGHINLKLEALSTDFYRQKNEVSVKRTFFFLFKQHIY